MMVGRQLGAEERAHGRDGRAMSGWPSATYASAATVAPTPCAPSPSRSGRGRSSASPECPATASASSARRSPGCGAPSGGSIRLDGVELAGRGPADARRAGLGYVPEERMRDGVVGEFTVAENIMLVESDRPGFSRWGFLRRQAIAARARELVEQFDVRTPSLDTPTRNLSGGNIQKLILARELSGDPKVLLVAQPTRGIDLAAAHYIHDQLRKHCRRGHRHPDHLRGPRRGHQPLRPDPGDVRGRGHRGGRPADDDAGGDRADDGRGTG